MRLLFTLVAVLVALLIHVRAQANPRVSARDSARLKYYIDTAFRCPLFSYRRNLYLDSALSIAPSHAYLWQQRAMPLEKQKKYELAIPFLDSAVKYNAAQYLEYRAFIKCIFQKSYRAALLDFYAVKAMNGSSGVMDHPYDFYIGLCHLQLNAIDSATDYFTKCVERKQLQGGDDAVHYLHWFYLGITHFVKEEYEPAIACFDKSLKQYSNFSDAENYKAECLQGLHQSKAALELMLKAQRDFADGYSINEDNAFYEAYPYQIIRYYVDGYVKYLRRITAQTGKGN